MISNNQKLFYKTKSWKFQTEWLLCNDLPVYLHYFEEIVTNSLKNTIKALRLSQFLHFKLIFVSNSNNDLGLLLFNIQLPLFIILLYFKKASKINLKNCYECNFNQCYKSHFFCFFWLKFGILQQSSSTSTLKFYIFSTK